MFGRNRSRPKVDTSHAIATNNKGLDDSSPTEPTASEIENIQTGADVISHSIAKQVQTGQAPLTVSSFAPTSATNENPQTNTDLSEKRAKTRSGQLKESKNDNQLSDLPPALTEEIEQAPAPPPEPASDEVISEPVPESTTVKLTQAADVPNAENKKVNSETENSTDGPRVSNDHAVLRSQQGQEPKPKSMPELSNNRGDKVSSINNNTGVQNQAPEASTPPRTSKQGEHGGVASGSTDQQVAIASKSNNHNNNNNHDMNSATHSPQSAQSVLPKKHNNIDNDKNDNSANKPETIEASQTPTKSESKKPLMRFLSKRHNTRSERKNPPATPKMAVQPPASSSASSSSVLPSVTEKGVLNPLSPTIEGRKWKDTDNDSLFCY